MTRGYPDPQVYDTTPKLLKYNAEQFPDDVALRQKNFGIWEEFTWAEFHQRVRHLSLAMQALEIGSNEVVALLGDNNVDWLFAEIAAHTVGAMSMGIYRDALDEEVGFLTEYAEVSAVYAEDQEQIDKILNLSDRLPKLKYIIFSDPRGLKKIADPRLRSIDDLIQHGRTLVDIHAVRAITNLRPWRGASASQRIPSSSWPPSSDNIAILVQADGHGAIVAAQKLRLRAIP